MVGVPNRCQKMPISKSQSSTPRPGEVLNKVMATGVCHTDLHAAVIGLPLVKFKDSPTRKALIGPSQNLQRRIDLVIVMRFAWQEDEAIFDRAGLGVQTHYLVAPRLNIIAFFSFLPSERRTRRTRPHQ